jgi:hypothetical protein
VEFEPALVDLLGGREALDSLGTVPFGDADFVSDAVARTTDFTPHEIVAALEEVEHEWMRSSLRGSTGGSKLQALRRMNGA